MRFCQSNKKVSFVDGTAAWSIWAAAPRPPVLAVGPLTSASEGALSVHTVSTVLGGFHSGPELLTDV